MNPDNRWEETWSLISLPAPKQMLKSLKLYYQEPVRAYHTVTHILDCLTRAKEIRGQLENPVEIELALWYHDTIYNSHKDDNEEQSAAFALSELKNTALQPKTLDKIKKFILGTKHPSKPTDQDTKYLVDIDLSILGASPEVFETYENGIKFEYSWVPEPVYKIRRREFLQSLLSPQGIYLTDYFREHFEEQALANIKNAISNLIF